MNADKAKLVTESLGEFEDELKFEYDPPCEAILVNKGDARILVIQEDAYGILQVNRAAGVQPGTREAMDSTIYQNLIKARFARLGMGGHNVGKP